MFDHVGLKVKQLGRSASFYTKALAPLGYSVQSEYEGGCGLGPEGKPALWLGQEPNPSGPVHLAFTATDRAAVRAFHEAALAAGGRDNGGPGLRESYGPTYYAAFALDPDGNNVEVVCHKA